MEQTLQGKVIKGLGGLYHVLCKDPKGNYIAVSCRAKGAFRHQEEKVLIGDSVTIRYDDKDPDNTSVIRDILPRKNALIRPPMANLDYLFCVIAAAKPAPVLETLDKLLAIATHNRITPIVVITKSDFSEEETRRYCSIYELAGFPTFAVSSTEERGIAPLKEYVDTHIVNGASAAFAGSSGVGKSTLLNALFPSLALATGEVSKKTERGKHTTRHVELFPLHHTLQGEHGYLADTPGFSLIDFAHFDFFGIDDLFDAFPDFAPYLGQCRYGDCTHTGEGPGECAIAKGVMDGYISPTRHESYVKIYRTLKAKNPYK